MLTISPGKFELDLNGETRTVLVSLGLKTELYKQIVKTQMTIAASQAAVQIDPVLAAKVKEQADLVAALHEEEKDAVKEEEVLEGLYAQALADLEARQQEKDTEIALEKVALTEESFAKLISLMLSDRDSTGKILKKVTEEEILWSQEYAEAQEELVDLVLGVVEYITSALKKISEINNLVEAVSENKKGTA